MNAIERQTNEYWRASKAWKREPGFVEGETYTSLQEKLIPLITQGVYHTLREQADKLSVLMVKGKPRIKRGSIAPTKVIRVDFTERRKVRIQITGQKTKATTAVAVA